MNRQTEILGFVFWVGVCFAAAFVGSVATTTGLDAWYANLNKPTFNPPNWVFGPVWTTLYMMMGTAAWFVWRREGFSAARQPLLMFLFQLFLNVLWSVLFFGLQQPGVAAIEIIFLWFSIGATIWLFSRNAVAAAWLMVPYWLWVSFAAVLNITIWQLNR